MNKTITIKLNADLKADLEWTKEIKLAESSIENGRRIFWDLNLGLFSSLRFPLDNGTQFMSLKLSVQHFIEKIWERFKDVSVGVCLYKGACDFNVDFPWDSKQNENLQGWLKEHFGSIETLNKESGQTFESFSSIEHTNLNSLIRSLFCRDAVAEYLGLLAGAIPETLPAYIILDTSYVTDPIQRALLSSQDRFMQFTVAFDKELDQVSQKEVAVAVLLPDMDDVIPSHFVTLRESIQKLENRNIDYRTIPDSLLISEWHGLDYLIVDPQLIDSEGVRRLQGFCAAGGTVLSLGNSLNLPYESPFSFECELFIS